MAPLCFANPLDRPRKVVHERVLPPVNPLMAVRVVVAVLTPLEGDVWRDVLLQHPGLGATVLVPAHTASGVVLCVQWTSSQRIQIISLA